MKTDKMFTIEQNLLLSIIREYGFVVADEIHDHIMEIDPRIAMALYAPVTTFSEEGMEKLQSATNHKQAKAILKKYCSTDNYCFSTELLLDIVSESNRHNLKHGGDLIYPLELTTYSIADPYQRNEIITQMTEEPPVIDGDPDLINAIETALIDTITDEPGIPAIKIALYCEQNPNIMLFMHSATRNVMSRENLATLNTIKSRKRQEEFIKKHSTNETQQFNYYLLNDIIANINYRAIKTHSPMIYANETVAFRIAEEKLRPVVAKMEYAKGKQYLCPEYQKGILKFSMPSNHQIPVW